MASSLSPTNSPSGGENEQTDELDSEQTNFKPTKNNVNPMQFMKVGPSELSKSAQKLLEKSAENYRELKKQEETEWQSNLDKWRMNRRKSQSNVIEKLQEVRLYEDQKDAEKAIVTPTRKTTTFEEMSKKRRSLPPNYKLHSFDSIMEEMRAVKEKSSKTPVNQDTDAENSNPQDITSEPASLSSTSSGIGIENIGASTEPTSIDLCRGCSKKLQPGEKVCKIEEFDFIYHTDCFNCSLCNRSLKSNAKFKIKKRKIVCLHCYKALKKTARSCEINPREQAINRSRGGRIIEEEEHVSGGDPRHRLSADIIKGKNKATYPCRKCSKEFSATVANKITETVEEFYGKICEHSKNGKKQNG